MTLPPLATAADLAARYEIDIPAGSPVEGRINQLLKDASAAIRRYARAQQISFVADDTQVLTAPGGRRLVLPQRPAVVDAEHPVTVKIDGTVVTGWRFDGRQSLIRDAGWFTRYDPWYSSTGTVEVTYSHGYQEVPDDVVGIACAAVWRAQSNPDALRSETIGDWSYQKATETLSGAVGLTEPEIALLQQAFAR